MLSILLVVYAAAVCLKRAMRSQGEITQVYIVTGFVLLPLLLVAWFVFDGHPLLALADVPANTDPASWWVHSILREEGPPVTVNLLSAGLILAGLYILTTLVIWAGSTLWERTRATSWLSIHKALIKWPVVLIGALVLLKIDLGTIVLGTSLAVIGLGLVLRETLENLFTGVTLELEGTVRRGDWIQVGDDSNPVGLVYEKTWRATKIKTLNDEAITIPNRLLGSERVRNFNRPMQPHARNLRVGTSYDDPPVKVKDVIRTILIREPDVLDRPAPLVRTIAYGDFAIEYEMKFWIRDYGRRRDIEDRIMTHVWYAFRFYGIQIPFPIRTVQLEQHEQREAQQQRIADDVVEKRRFLDGLPYFAGLPPKDRDFLAQNAFRREYAPGEQVIHKGEIGDALYLVWEGHCEAVLPGGARPRLEPGRYFGEMGLLSAGRRTVDVVAGDQGASVMRVDRHCMHVLFETHPELQAEFLEVDKARRQELPQDEPQPMPPRPPLLERLGRGALDVLRPW